MTRRQAAEYLACSVASIDRRLAEMAHNPIRGKMRFSRIDDWGTQREPVRILAADVHAMLPDPHAVKQTEAA
jgi:hypothetical protein